MLFIFSKVGGGARLQFVELRDFASEKESLSVVEYGKRVRRFTTNDVRESGKKTVEKICLIFDFD